MAGYSSYPDRAFHSIRIAFSLSPSPEKDLHHQLSEAINRLINDDFPQLINILYRLDISEIKVKSILKLSPEKNAGELIADLIIERQRQKLDTLRQFRSNDDIADEEKW